MSSKTGGDKKKKKSKKSQSLISKLNAKLLKDRGRHCFNEWYTEAEIDSFRDNPAIDELEPLFIRYQNKMEKALENFAADEGLRDESEIIEALRSCRDDDVGKSEWKKLGKFLNLLSFGLVSFNY